MPGIIWITEDDPGIQEIVELILKEDGYTVVADKLKEVSNVDDINQLNDLPDLFIIDGLMGGRHGLDLCRLLKKHSSTKHIPVIILSAISNIKELAVDSYADSVIEKPFDISELLNTIAAILKNK